MRKVRIERTTLRTGISRATIAPPPRRQFKSKLSQWVISLPPVAPFPVSQAWCSIRTSLQSSSYLELHSDDDTSNQSNVAPSRLFRDSLVAERVERYRRQDPPCVAGD